MAGRLGVYRDPWFGDVSICEAGEGVRFASAKSPLMTGDVMRVGDRLLVQWHRPDIEPWLHFGPEGSQPTTLQMSKIDPDADFSADFEDLSFRSEERRVGEECVSKCRSRGSRDH